MITIPGIRTTLVKKNPFHLINGQPNYYKNEYIYSAYIHQEYRFLLKKKNVFVILCLFFRIKKNLCFLQTFAFWKFYFNGF